MKCTNKIEEFNTAKGYVEETCDTEMEKIGEIISPIKFDFQGISRYREEIKTLYQCGKCKSIKLK
jgi:hypothetical protein